MENSELVKKAKELVARKRKIIRAGLELLIKTGGNYSEEDKKTASAFANESRCIALEREIILKEAWNKLDVKTIEVLEIEYMDAIKEEMGKVRQKIEEIFGPKKDKKDKN